MTRRVVEDELRPEGPVRETADEASGALVVLHAPAGTATAGSGGAAEGDDADASLAARPDGAGSDVGAGSGREGGAGVEEASRALEALEDEALRRFEVRRVLARVRPGAPAGEAAVEVVVRAPHRADAFEAARWAVAAARERVLPLVAGPRGQP